MNECPKVGVSVRLRPVDSEDDLAHRPAVCDLEHGVHDVDVVHDDRSNQEELFQQTTRNVVESFLRGTDVVFIVCGGKKTGKTYSLQGVDGKCDGIIQRTCAIVCEHLQLVSENRFRLTFSCCALTTGPEAAVVDLLATKTRMVCSIRDVPSRVAMEKLTQKDLYSATDLQKVLLSDSDVNSILEEIHELPFLYHMAWTFQISQRVPEKGVKPISTRLTFVELTSAGQKRCIETPSTMEESAIATGMSALTGVFKFLGKRKYMSHTKKPDRCSRLSSYTSELVFSGLSLIPWRDSSLTKWLQAYMETAKTIWILATVNSSPRSAESTLATLNFVSRIRSLSLHATNGVIVQPRWTASCHCDCDKQLNFKDCRQQPLPTGKRMNAGIASRKHGQVSRRGGMQQIEGTRHEAKARLVLKTAAENEKGSDLNFRSCGDLSTSLGDGAFTELLGILRKDHGSVKGEALLESLFQKSSYLREQLYNERARNRRIQAEIEDSTDTVRDLEHKNSELDNELEALQKQLADVQLQNTTVQTQLEKNCATVLELKNEMKRATTDHEDALQQERVRGHRSMCKVEESKKELDRLKSQIQLLSQQVGFETSKKLSFQSKTEMLESENECCKKKLNCLSEYCKNLESEKSMILKDYQTKATEVESLQAAMIQMESSKKALEQELNESTQKMRNNEESMNSLRKLNDELHQKVDSLSSDRERLQSLEEELKQLFKLRADLCRATNYKSSKDSRPIHESLGDDWAGLADDLLTGVLELENEVKTGKSQSNGLNIELEKVRKERDCFQESLNIANSQVSSLKAQLSESLKKAEMVAQLKDEEKRSLNSQLEALKKCESEKELLSVKLKETTEKLMESIETQSMLETKLSAFKFKEETLQRTLSDERIASHTTMEELKQLRRTITEYEASLQQSESVRGDLEKKNESLLVELRHHQFKNDALQKDVDERDSRFKLFDKQLEDLREELEALHEEKTHWIDLKGKLVEENERLKECLVQQSTTNKDLDDRIERLSHDAKTQELERLQSNADQERSDREIKKLRTEIASLESLQSRQTEEHRQLVQKMEWMQDENDQLEKLKESFQTCIEERNAIQLQNKSLNNEIEALLVMNKKINIEKESLRVELSAVESDLRKQKMDSLLAASRRTSSSSSGNQARLRRSQTEVQKKFLPDPESLFRSLAFRSPTVRDKLNPRRHFSSVPEIEPIVEETISARVSRLASNASDVLEEIGKSLAVERSDTSES